MNVNRLTQDLTAYPFEDLARQRRALEARGVKVYDFGAGDPLIRTWPPIVRALRDAVPEASVYPSIRGLPELADAQRGYLERRFGIARSARLAVAPCLGAREAIFHAALCLIGRSGGRRRLLVPDPGYPVYGMSAAFAGGLATTVPLDAKSGYLLEPWSLPQHVIDETAALWVNYPNNPVGCTAPAGYWRKLLEWARRNDVVVLSDEPYIDTYDAAFDDALARDPSDDRRPVSPLQFGAEGVMSFHSLSKRSGLAGYRTGFIAGDPDLVCATVRARSFFGLAGPEFVERAAAVAWSDDAHAAERRRVFSRRVHAAFPLFRDAGLIDEPPAATFYLWCRAPERFGGDETAFTQALAARGVLASPSRWFGGSTRGHVRFALAPDEAATAEAAGIVREVARG